MTLVTETPCDKLHQLVAVEGYNDVYDLMDERGLDSVVPGICTTMGCNYTAEVEPDCSHGWCPCCRMQTVKSYLVLAGVI